MKVRYLYSACVVIETRDCRICCDPWFTPGAYDGSWFQYPPLARDAVDAIGEVDLIYVSHIHPDHYDRDFLARYLRRYPGARIVIGHTDPPHLERKMRIDGFAPLVVEQLSRGTTEVFIFANRSYEVANIDTALAVRSGDLSVVDLNDNPLDVAQVARLRAVCSGGRPDVALLPYSGAGPYPQTYWFASEQQRAVAAASKRRRFLELYAQYLAALAPRRAIPFAGKYWLGGALSGLNASRGLACATDLLALHPGVTVVLDDGGDATLDVATLEPSATRTRPYDAAAVDSYLASLPDTRYAYEREIQPLGGRDLPLLPLAAEAYRRARRATDIGAPLWYCIRPSTREDFLTFEPASDSGVKLVSDVTALSPRIEISIDARYLFGLLTRLYHWNNAEIGSHYTCKRVPDEFRRETYAFLHHFHV